ncbi:AraC family transcriptional regulator ligand-binding domain-containing protein [Brenneria goodwinii]|uniref:AraC family transcriptional regulator ligand-binding domain-containing protein n=1 Tax=Brenneria goodwinii TaxID=1109412 RepID=UPI000EF2595B|nr:AraC family transcriptional regulator ligand-binding domain-containing protein [Brenneria goodwinii]MCG8158656.1 AraC family transcriptional regulator ligand-binding domain-containing protein [Brenneria goodwinii]MCG8162737.1 AraC family transcriptional regulator ligand-binding domain-containing protein [Brenneria goodwinii]MCG8167861.1 AraC family transcriptional regulator ligand-binding domain-containing protein [Brenneria goodwinii]MCG8172444.1 AraC family transcriptional regulator ligand
MTAHDGWYECDDRFIVGHHQPGILIDLALSRDIDGHRLLRGTGVFLEDIAAGAVHFSQQQFGQLIDNSIRLLDADDTSFLFGRRSLPGCYGNFSHVLQQADNLHQALDDFIRFCSLFSPLLAPRMYLDDRYLCLYWPQSDTDGGRQRFLLEASMTSIASLGRWLSPQQPLPWRFLFNYRQPRYIEQYWVHLGDGLSFDQPLNMMLLPAEYVWMTSPHANSTVCAVVRQQCLQQLETQGFRRSFIDYFYDHLRDNLRDPLNLERVAASLNMSPATLKRKLRKHDSSFQEQWDRVRKHTALFLYWFQGLTNEEVAQYLHISDINNFRRSFRRWTGIAPSVLSPLPIC